MSLHDVKTYSIHDNLRAKLPGRTQDAHVGQSLASLVMEYVGKLRLIAHVASLHVHPGKAGGPVKGGSMISQPTLTLVQDKGIKEDTRYFDRPTRKGTPSPRQVSIIDRGMISWHATQQQCAMFLPGTIRTNIETKMMTPNHDLSEPPACPYIDLLGQDPPVGGGLVQLGDGTDAAVIQITVARTPCWEMDHISPGLQNAMKRDRQGALASVVESGIVREGDPVFILFPDRFSFG